MWGFGILGKGPNVDMLKEPSLLPPALFGCNELQPGVKVTQVKCGMSHFAAVTGMVQVILLSLVLYVYQKYCFSHLITHLANIVFWGI